MRQSLVTIIAVLLLTSTSFAESYRFDGGQSEISFKIGHPGGTAKGRFKDFVGELEFFPDQPQRCKVKLVIQVSSVDTGSPARDQHLQDEDYFDTARFPTMTFESRTFKKRGDLYVVTGPLSMHGVEKEITLQVKLERRQQLWAVPGQALTFSSKTKLDRVEFGVEGGRPTVGDEVTIDLQIKALEI